jgi:deoxycytidine triphosphate deaminase
MSDQPASPHPLSSQPDWKTKDPDFGKAGQRGLLLSNQIDMFCQSGLLIEKDYVEENLRPAAYTLTIGDDYVNSSGTKQKLSAEEQSFEMEPNSIVFVSVKEKLNLPYYIVARFNLRVEWVYKGILLGTGPQVEPGFRGFLSCPLYNLTNRPHTIVRGEPFATIDFERTTSFVDKTPKEVAERITARDKLDQYSCENEKFLLFKQKELSPLGKYPTDYKIVSSLAELSRETKMWRNISIAIVVSFLTLTLSLLGFHSNLLRETLANGKDAAQLRQQLADALQQQAKEATELQQQLKDQAQLRQELENAKQQINDLQNTQKKHGW